jgi:hypothetical protein
MQNWGRDICKPTMGMRVYMRIVMNGVKSNKLSHSKKSGCKKTECSQTETFINTPGPHLIERLTDCSNLNKQHMEFKYT